MSLLIKDISLIFDSQVVFDHISCTIHPSDRIGLVGANGSGKSTLLRVIAGQQTVDSGTIQSARGTTIGYMPQDLTLTSSRAIIDEIVQACHVEETELEALKAEAKKILMGLGFSIQQFEQPVSILSVGWKMRVLLAQLLLQKADFYLFDEPTNHLDIVAKEWFLYFLKNARFGFVLVCHDRYFLDQLCTTIFELELGNCTKYRGNYTDYQNQKTHRLEIVQASYENQQRDIERKQRTIDRFRAQASRARMVKKMERDLGKIERITLPSAVKTINFSFPVAQQSGKVVLEVEKLAVSFGAQKVFNNVSCIIQRGERVAIIAANGVGKTTLLNVIMGKLAPHAGTIRFGHNVTCAYFEQDQMAVLNPEKTIFDTVSDCAQKAHAQEIRDILGCFLFSQDFMNKKIKVLSGGEKNRVCMVCTLLQRANFLILDEPTNHLDIQSKEILLEALKKYHGTILFVSHDHWFVQELATNILELGPEGTCSYEGTYEQYLEQKRQWVSMQQESQKPVVKNEVIKLPKQREQGRSEISKLEKQIQKLEQEVAQLHKQFETLVYGSPEFAQATVKLQAAQERLAHVTQQWENLYDSNSM